jgi:hypothetical protein
MPGCTGTLRRMFPGPATSTWYPPEACASSAVTGTPSTFRTLAVVMFAVTGAWSNVPAAPGSVSVTCTGIVVVVPPELPDVGPPTERGPGSSRSSIRDTRPTCG